MAKNSVTDWSTTDSLNTDVGGTNIAEGCAPGGINDAIRKVMSQVASFRDSGAFGALTVGGSAVWHAGNFTPANYALLSGAGFSGTVTSPLIGTPGGTGAVNLNPGNASNTGYAAFFNAAGVRQGYMGFALTNGPLQYNNDTGNGHSFGGGNVSVTAGSFSASGNVVANGSLYPANDGQLYIGKNTGNPFFNMDTNDYYYYDRAGNVYNWNIGGSVQFAVGVNSVWASGDLQANRLIARANGTGQNIQVGDDTWLGDINVVNTLGVRGQQDFNAGFVQFGNSGTQLGCNANDATLRYGGATIWHSNNFAFQSGTNANGRWRRTPDGDYEMRGSTAIPAGSNTATFAITFPASFPTNCEVVVGNADAQISSRAMASVIMTNHTTTGCTCIVDTGDPSAIISAGHYVQWIAKGV